MPPSAPSSNPSPLLAADHAARESTLDLAQAVSLRCGRVRPLAWCSPPRNWAQLLEAALAGVLRDAGFAPVLEGLRADLQHDEGLGRHRQRAGGAARARRDFRTLDENGQLERRLAIRFLGVERNAVPHVDRERIPLAVRLHVE